MVAEVTKLTPDNRYEIQVNITEVGAYRLLFQAKTPTCWSVPGNESVIVRLYVDNQYNQDIICFYGSQLFTYERLLGHLNKGTHSFRFEVMSLTETQEVYIEEVQVERTDLTEEEALVSQFSPLLYGRNVYGAYDQLHTDTPLMLIYSLEEVEDGQMIEYHVVFSHEDKGTPAPFLMAKWGRLLDIEYAIRVYLTKDHNVEKMEFQGANHIITPYAVEPGSVQFPILQTATCNGNFTDEITSTYRARFVPKKWDRENQPREFVMEAYPFVNQVMIWEAERQLDLNKHQDAHSINLIHPCHYAYIHASFVNQDAQTPPVEFQVKFKGDDTWYSSSFHWIKVYEFEAVYTGEFPHFATTLKCPPDKRVQDIEVVRPEVKPNTGTKVEIGGIHVYELGKNGSFTKRLKFAGGVLGEERQLEMDRNGAS